MAARFWVGGDGDWNDPTHWGTVSGQAYPTSGVSVPTSADSVTINTASAPAGADYTIYGFSTQTCGQLTVAGPTGFNVYLQMSLNVNPTTAALTSTISANVRFNTIYFDPQIAGTHTLSCSANQNSGDLYIANRSGSTTVLSGTMYINSFGTYGDYGAGNFTFSSASIRVSTSQYISINSGGGYAATTALNSCTFTTFNFNVGGGGPVYTGSGNILQTPNIGSYQSINWLWPSGIVFPGSLIGILVNGGTNNAYPTGTITLTDCPSFPINVDAIGRCGNISLTRSTLGTGVLTCAAITLNTDPTTGCGINSYSSSSSTVIDCTAITATAAATAPHFINAYGSRDIVLSGSMALTNCSMSAGTITVAGVQTITVSNTANTYISWAGSIVGGTGTVSLTNISDAYIRDINTTGAVNINNTANINNSMASYNNINTSYSQGTYKFASGTWTDVKIFTPSIIYQITGAFTIAQSAGTYGGGVTFGNNPAGNNTFGGAFSLTSYGGVDIQGGSSSNITFSSTAAFINSGYNSSWTLFTSSSGNVTFTGALTITGARLSCSPSGTLLHSSTVTINSNATGGYGSYTSGPATFNGVITLNAGTATASSGVTGGNQFSNSYVTSLVSINSTGLSNAVPNSIYLGGSTVAFSGNCSLSDTDVTGTNTVWKQTGATTLTVSGAAGNNTPLTFGVAGLWMGTGAVSFTNNSLTLYGQFDDGTGTLYALKSSTTVVMTGATTTSSGINFTVNSISGNVVFVAGVSAITWTDVFITMPTSGFGAGSFTVNGSGGFTLAGGAKNSAVSATSSNLSVTGPLAFTLGSSGTKSIYWNNINANSSLNVTGAGLNSSFNGVALSVGAGTTLSNVSISMYGVCFFNSTFSWTSTVANANTVSLGANNNALTTFLGTATITTAASVTFYSINSVNTFSSTGLDVGNYSSFHVGGPFVGSAVSVTKTDSFTFNSTLNCGAFTATGIGNTSTLNMYDTATCTGAVNISAIPTPNLYALVASGALNLTGTGANSTCYLTNGGVVLNSVGGIATINNISLSVSGQITFGSTFNWTSTFANGNTINIVGSSTFTGAATITNPIALTLSQFNTVTCNNSFSVSNTSLVDHRTVAYNFIIGNFISTNAASTTTFTNVRTSFQGSTGNSIAGSVVLATNGGFYLDSNVTTTISGLLTSSGASTFFPIEASEGNGSSAILALNGAVTLVNANLKVPTITVAGGATKNFAYSLSTPIPDNRGTDGFGNVSYNYPEIAFDTFTLTNTGGTFSIAGGGAVNLRTLISPFSFRTQSTPSTAAMNIAVNPTFTDVDFWRIVPGGASTKPWTGTRLGNVGTLTNITTPAGKTVYWTGGGGSWDAARWSLLSDGTGAAAANYPLPQDTTVFNSSSGVGNITLPANVRFKDVVVDSISAGTLTVYSTAPNFSNISTYMLMSGSFYGPNIPTVGTFIFGNNSTYSQTTQINLVVADSSSSDVHNIITQNLQFLPNGGLLFANLGTLNVTNDIANSSGNELAFINAYSITDSATRQVNFTCNRVGRTTTSSNWDINSSSYIFSYGTFDLGGCAFGAATCQNINATIANTAYTVIVSNYAQMGSSSTLNAGNIIFRFSNVALQSNIYIGFYSASNTVNYKDLSIYAPSFYSGCTVYFSSSTTGSPTISCYSFTFTNSGSTLFLRVNGSRPVSLVKTGGGKVSLPLASVTPSGSRLNASPANTWYVPGGLVGSGSTGWSTSTVSTNTGGFFMF